jgi:hypothetical protein
LGKRPLTIILLARANAVWPVLNKRGKSGDRVSAHGWHKEELTVIKQQMLEAQAAKKK